MNPICLAQIRLVNTVNLSKLDVLLFERGGGLFIVGSESFAVSAPEKKTW